MDNVRAGLYVLLTLYGVIAFFWSIGGMMMDSNNRYPLPLLISGSLALLATYFITPT